MSWCRLRAELVLKCTKGFVLEHAQWDDHKTTRTLQFQVPPSTDVAIFRGFSAMIDGIFQVSSAISQ